MVKVDAAADGTAATTAAATSAPDDETSRHAVTDSSIDVFVDAGTPSDDGDDANGGYNKPDKKIHLDDEDGRGGGGGGGGGGSCGRRKTLGLDRRFRFGSECCYSPPGSAPASAYASPYASTQAFSYATAAFPRASICSYASGASASGASAPASGTSISGTSVSGGLTPAGMSALTIDDLSGSSASVSGLNSTFLSARSDDDAGRSNSMTSPPVATIGIPKNSCQRR